MRRALDKLDAQFAADLAAAIVPDFARLDPAMTTGAQVKFVLDLLAEIRLMLKDTEQRILATFNLRSTFDDDRWTRAEARMTRIERNIGEQSDRLGVHLEEARLADATIDARLQPVTYLIGHWRTVALVVLAMLALTGVTIDFLRIGGMP